MTIMTPFQVDYPISDTVLIKGLPCLLSPYCLEVGIHRSQTLGKEMGWKIKYLTSGHSFIVKGLLFEPVLPYYKKLFLVSTEKNILYIFTILHLK